MYFPYFRGRQYELLALKELAGKRLISSNVVPVIEPIKFMPALNNALSTFEAKSLPISLIYNPSVGDLAADGLPAQQLFTRFSSNRTIIPAVLMNKNTLDTVQILESYSVQKDNMLVVLNSRDYLDDYKALYEAGSPRCTLCPDERAIRRATGHNRVLFEDYFKKQPRNADYPDDEFFSDDHLYYKEDPCLGFGDYSMVGRDYNESGFAPYAVAIHIVYFAEDETLRIRHFVSDSNEDISDVAGKFYEAVTKLNTWYESGQEHQLTTGLQILLDHYKNGTYPGLPTLKKLSIMHHLELVSRYLGGDN